MGKKIHSMQYSATSWQKQLRFWVNRGSGHMFWYLINRVKWHWYPKARLLPSFPDHIDIETTNACNMKCPMCYRDKIWKQRFNFKDKSMGFLDYELYKKIIDEAAAHGVFSIRLSWRGEPLVHPRVADMVRYAKLKGIKSVSTLTNGLNLDEKLARELIDAGIDWISNSFDGTGKIYESIRAPAKYPEALERLRTIQRIKKEKGLKKPVLKVQTVFAAIKDNPEEFYRDLGPIVDEIAVNDTQDHSLKNKDQNPNYFCPVPWQRLVVTWSGEAVQCINDFNERNIVGDLNTQSVADVWNGPEMKKVRELILKKERLKMLACTECFDGDRRDIIKVKLGDHAVRGGDLGFEFKNIEKAKNEGLRLDETMIRDREMKEENVVEILE